MSAITSELGFGTTLKVLYGCVIFVPVKGQLSFNTETSPVTIKIDNQLENTGTSPLFFFSSSAGTAERESEVSFCEGRSGLEQHRKNRATT